MRLHNRFTQTEAQSVTAGFPGTGFIGPVKRFPDMDQRPGLDADPVVSDGDIDPVFS